MDYISSGWHNDMTTQSRTLTRADLGFRNHAGRNKVEDGLDGAPRLLSIILSHQMHDRLTRQVPAHTADYSLASVSIRTADTYHICTHVCSVVLRVVGYDTIINLRSPGRRQSSSWTTCRQQWSCKHKFWVPGLPRQLLTVAATTAARRAGRLLRIRRPTIPHATSTV